METVSKDERRAQIDDIKKRYPLQDVAARYTTLRKSGAYLKGRCPFHDDRTPSFTVHLPTGTWRCWSACDAGGDVIDLVGYAKYGAAWNSRDPAMFVEALRLLAGELPPLRQPVPKEWSETGKWKPIELEPRLQMALGVASRIYHTTLVLLGKEAGTPYAYLRARGFDDLTIHREGIGYAGGGLLVPALIANGLSRQAAVAVNLLDPQRGRREFMAGRIVFVDCDRAGCVLHLVGRKFAPWLKDESPKYLSLKEIGKPLHGYARLDHRSSDSPVVVVESPPDAVTARMWGFDAAANIGTGMKEEHAVLLARLRRSKVYVPHNDGGIGLEAAWRWRDKVGDGTVVCLPEGVKDLNEMAVASGGRDEFLRRMKDAGFAPKAPARPTAGETVEELLEARPRGLLAMRL